MTSRIGAITIGQSPRDDVVSELKGLITSKDIEVVEKGALDRFSLEAVKRLAPRKDDEVLVTRMRDGTEVTIGKRAILEELQKQINALNAEGVDGIAMLCSGAFPRLRSKRPLIMLDNLVYGFLASIVFEGKLGFIVPSHRQIAGLGQDFQRRGFQAAGVEASPYGHDTMTAITQAAKSLKEAGVDLVVMNCIGYDLAMKHRVKGIVNKPVLLVRSILAKSISELLD
ncbi:MAG: AroM family protein [Candidatus Bipolaricaulia bacterium]